MPKNYKIAIVDCDPKMRLALQELFEAHGDTVECYASTRAFTASLDQNMPQADVLLCRFELEGNCGVALLKYLDQASRSTPAVIYSSGGDIPAAVGSLRAGAKDFIDHAKPDCCFRQRILSLLHPPLKASPAASDRPVSRTATLRYSY